MLSKSNGHASTQTEELKKIKNRCTTVCFGYSILHETKKNVQQSVLATVTCIKSWKYIQQSVLVTLTCIKSGKYAQQSVLATVSCVKSQEHAQQYVLATIPCIKLWNHVQTVCLGSTILWQFMITRMSICLGNNTLHRILWWQLQRGFMNKCTKINLLVPFTKTFEYYKQSLNNKTKLYITYEKK